MTATGDGGLWRRPSFRLLYLAATVSFCGSQLSRVVLPLLVFQRTGSPLGTGLLVAVQTTPYLLFGLVAGAVADRVSRRALLVAGNAANGLVVACIPLLDALSAVSEGLIYAVAAVSATLWVITDAANFGAVPAICGRRQLVAALSALNVTWTVVGLVALPLGGALAAAVGPAVVLWVDAGSYGLAAILLAGIRTPLGPAPDPERTAAPRRLLGDVVAGLAYVRRHELIGPLTWVGVAASATSGGVLALVVAYGTERLGLASDDARLGWLYGAGAAGAALAATALPALTRRVAAPRITPTALGTSAALLLAVALAPVLALGVLALAAWEAAITLVVLNGISLRQQMTPDHLQARVNTTGRMLAASGLPIGAAVAGALATALGTQPVLLLLAAVSAVGAVAAVGTALWGTDRARLASLVTAASRASPEPSAERRGAGA